jgi:hypothetical protein
LPPFIALGQAAWMRVAVLGLLGFLGCVLASARLYPGGTWSDPQALGFSFWQNFWCDLLSPVAIGGGDHLLGSFLARAGFACFALCMWRFWPLAAAFSGNAQSTAWAARLGKAGAVALVGVSLVPSMRSEELHAVLVTLSAGAGIVAALLLLPALWPRTDRLTRLLGTLLVLSSTVTLLQYLRQGITRANYADWLAGSQKIASACMLLWMARLLWLIWRRARAAREVPGSNTP